jgi:hypothetical protein
MKEVSHHVVSEGLGRGSMWLMDTLYNYYGETIVVVAVLSVLIIPCVWNVITANHQNNTLVEKVEMVGGWFLMFSSFGIASRAAWAVIAPGDEALAAAIRGDFQRDIPTTSFSMVVFAFISAFAAACVIWWFSAKVGDELSDLRMGRSSKWFSKAGRASASIKRN